MSRQYALGILPLFKKCPRCLVLLGHTEFWRTVNNPDGLYDTCKACAGRGASERNYARSLKRAHQEPWTSRECLRCRRTLPADRFSPNTSHRSGLHSSCRACENARQRGKRAMKKG